MYTTHTLLFLVFTRQCAFSLKEPSRFSHSTSVLFIYKLFIDVAKIVFTRSISHDENVFLVHDYSLLEDYSAPATTTQTDGEVYSNTQTSSSQSIVTSASIATTTFINYQDKVSDTLQENGAPPSTTANTETDETPWWLEHKDNRECEDQDDLPSHPLTLMVYMQITLQYIQ